MSRMSLCGGGSEHCEDLKDLPRKLPLEGMNDHCLANASCCVALLSGGIFLDEKPVALNESRRKVWIFLLTA